MPTERTYSPAQRAAARRIFYKSHFLEFAAEQLKIQDAGGGALLPLVPNAAQQLFYHKCIEQQAIQGYVRAIWLKSRQTGASTWTQALAYHQCVFNENYSSLLISADDKSTKNVFRIAHLFYDSMDTDIRPMIMYLNREELYFGNPDRHTRGQVPGLNSRMDFQTAKNALAGTGATKQFYHLTEVAKWSEAVVDQLTASFVPSIHPRPGTWLVMESTAEESGDYFREQCELAEEAEKKRHKSGRYVDGGSQFFFCFVPWWIDTKNTEPLLEGETLKLSPEERQITKYADGGFQREFPHLKVPRLVMTPEHFKYRRNRIAQMGLKSWNQDYPENPKDAWISRDEYVFDPPRIHDMQRDIDPPQEFIELLASTDRKQRGPDIMTVKVGTNVKKHLDYLAVWRMPVPLRVYDIGVDVASGVEDGDWSVAQVLDRQTREQVAELHKHLDPVELGRELNLLGLMYNTAQMTIEMNGPGIVTNQELERLNYPYLHAWRNMERFGLPMTGSAGWQTNQKSKEIMVNFTRHYVHHKELVVHSQVLLDEMRWFVQLGRYDYRASGGHFDDGVMALMIAVMGGLLEGVGGVQSAPTPKEVPRFQSIATCDDFDPDRSRMTGRIADELREMRGMR